LLDNLLGTKYAEDLIGLVQFRRLDEFIADRYRVARRYGEEFIKQGVEGARPLSIPLDVRSSWYKYIVMLDEWIDEGLGYCSECELRDCCDYIGEYGIPRLEIEEVVFFNRGGWWKAYPIFNCGMDLEKVNIEEVL
jgi:hypothetical protein